MLTFHQRNATFVFTLIYFNLYMFCSLILQSPQLSEHYSIPTYAVARREIPQGELQDEQMYIISFSDNKMPLPNETRFFCLLEAFNCTNKPLQAIVLNHLKKSHNRPFCSCMLSYLAMNASEAGGDHGFIQTSLLYSFKWKLFSIRKTWFTQHNQWGLYQNKVTSSLAAIQRPGYYADNCKRVNFGLAVWLKIRQSLSIVCVKIWALSINSSSLLVNRSHCQW